MLNKDILSVILLFLESKDAKIARIVCKLWNNIIKSRFQVLYTSATGSYVPEYCNTVVCYDWDISAIHEGIKKLYIYKGIDGWSQDVDALIIQSVNRRNLCETQTTIDCNVGDLVILSLGNVVCVDRGEILNPYTNLDDLGNQEIFYLAYMKMYITSHPPCKLNSPGMKIICIKPGSKIKKLIISTSHLYLMNIDADIESIWICNDCYVETLNAITIHTKTTCKIIYFTQKLLKINPKYYRKN